jgi:hypothetical protein
MYGGRIHCINNRRLHCLKEAHRLTQTEKRYAHLANNFDTIYVRIYPLTKFWSYPIHTNDELEEIKMKNRNYDPISLLERFRRAWTTTNQGMSVTLRQDTPRKPASQKKSKAPARRDASRSTAPCSSVSPSHRRPPSKSRSKSRSPRRNLDQDENQQPSPGRVTLRSPSEIEEVEKQKKRMERFKIEVPMPEEILFPGSTSRQNVPAPSPQSSSPPPKNALERARERAKQSKGRTIPRFFDADSMKF